MEATWTSQDCTSIVLTKIWFSILVVRDLSLTYKINDLNTCMPMWQWSSVKPWTLKCRLDCGLNDGLDFDLYVLGQGHRQINQQLLFQMLLAGFMYSSSVHRLTYTGRQNYIMSILIILKWSYLMIFMRVLVAVSVRWCKV